MKSMLLFIVIVFGSFAVSAKPSCPTTATCPEHGASGNPTGQHKWQGSKEYAQFSHPLFSGGEHLWWERCD
jgi:hypothetical protein